MATVLVEKWGNSTGPNEYAQFQTYAALGYSEKDDVKGYHICKRCYVVVSTGNTGFQGTIAHTNWSDDFRMYLSGTYVDSDWVDGGWVGPGSTYSVEGVAYYDSDNGTRYTSTASASYTASSKTVTYDANDGTGAPNSQTTLADAEVTLSSTKPTRTGYTFKGWATSKTATTANYQPGNKYTAKSSVTLYAVWQINTWTISYNSNGGTGTIANQTKTYNKPLTLSNGSGFNKTGYTLTSWNTKSDGSGQKYDKSASYKGNAALTLYAIWTVNKLTVNYYSNYATSALDGAANEVGKDKNVLVLTQNFAYDTKHQYGLADYSGTGGAAYMTRDGYNATGYWGTELNGGTLVSESKSFDTGQALAEEFGKTLETGSVSINIYAQWTIKTYTITYDKNTTDTVDNIPSSQTKTHGTSINLSTNVPARKQYKFYGWATTSSSSAEYQPGEPYSVDKDVVLYAVWELTASKVTIYDSNGSPQSYLCYVYDEFGVPHYAIVSIYDAQGVPHSVT